jgi:glycogen operon protein
MSKNMMDPATAPRFGAVFVDEGVRFSVWSSSAERLWLCLFDRDGKREIERIPMQPDGSGMFHRVIAGLDAGQRYGLRADGPYDPDCGLYFDPDKLLVDPYAVRIDRAYRHDTRLTLPRGQSGDTADLVPKAILTRLPEPPEPGVAINCRGGLIYEIPVRGFTRLHPAIPEVQRGTLAALAHPATIEHLQGLNVAAVELMPIAAWIDERHLPSMGLHNAWGYNPLTFMTLDPRLAPHGIQDLRLAVEALHEAGIGVILDVVFNHTGESDAHGATLSMRGLDNTVYYRRDPGVPGTLINDTGCGNTLACDHPVVVEMMRDAMRHFVRHAGVDGFRFDLATILARRADGFDRGAPFFSMLESDPILSNRELIAEPWDIGPGGYQLGQFPERFLEWSDRYRDDVRSFWRGDSGKTGMLATRLAGSTDIFGAARNRSVNFIAAHDGMTMHDIVSYASKHNQANGEGNRDGHDENYSWNNGIEGASDQLQVQKARRRDTKALLATLFASHGTLLLTAGDEFGRSQSGNNNAYAQDNTLTWLDWSSRDLELENYTRALSRMRLSWAILHDGCPPPGEGDVLWLDERGQPFDNGHWHDPDRRCLTMILYEGTRRLAVIINGGNTPASFQLPDAGWSALEPNAEVAIVDDGCVVVTARSVMFFESR